MGEKLKHNLEALQQELRNIGSENPKLKKLYGDVDAALNGAEDTPRALVESLKHAAEEFEVHHPQLTAIINNVMTSLSSLGI